MENMIIKSDENRKTIIINKSAVNYNADLLCSLVKRIVNAYEEDTVITEEDDIIKIEFIDRELKIINTIEKAIDNREHAYSNKNIGAIYDIKLGYSCNNNCFHCVIKPNLLRLEQAKPNSIKFVEEGFRCTEDLSYDDIIKELEVVEDGTRFVVTGGEPTLREDLPKIFRWLYYNKPKSHIGLQTNGRNLSNIELVKALRRFSRNNNFVVAIHSHDEKIHNDIVNNRKDSGNPYLEIVQGIQNLHKIFKDDLRIRVEIVMSKKNIQTLHETIKFVYEELNINNIGISYPHLEGYSKANIDNICPSYNEIKSALELLGEYKRKNDGCNILFEEIPPCMYVDSNTLGLFIDMDGERGSVDIKVNFMGNETNNYKELYFGSHMKLPQCDECELREKCIGVWWETAHILEDYLKPVKGI